MEKVVKTILIFYVLTLFGCASISYLPSDETKKYSPTQQVKVFWEKPKAAYKIIGKISIESGDYTEEELFVKLKVKAMEVGAHALIMSGTSKQSSVIGVPAYGGGTIITPVTSTRIEAIVIRFE